MCFDATSSFVAGGAAYGVSAYLLRRKHARLKWGAVALMGITMMQWVEGFLWLDGPLPHGTVNKVLTIGLIPVALLAQAWGPLFGSAWEVPISKRKSAFYGLLTVGLLFVVIARVVQHPTMTQGHTSGISQLVVSSKSANFPGLGVRPLGLGDRHAFFDLVEADVASSADLLVGLVLGYPEFFDHRQRCELLVLLCLFLRNLRLHLRTDDRGFTAS